VALFALPGCERARRVPRIEPDLRGWERPYRGIPGLEIHVFDTGALSLPRGFLFQGGSWLERAELPTPAYVIRSPGGNAVVFDPGFSERINRDPNRYIGFFASVVGRFAMAEEQALAAQMRRAGIEPASVSHIVVSHLHFDHAGGIEDFPNAELVVSYAERSRARHADGGFSFFNASDFDSVTRWREIEFDASQPYATFAGHVDLLGDDSIHLVPLPGHTLGSLGVIVRLQDAPILLAGDAAPVEESWRFAAMPFHAEDRDLWWETIWRIKKFQQLVPGSIVLGGHDTRGLAIEDRRTVVSHPYVAERVRR
jgi:glyoxylase-like metal-dependent hydrolase (beta-lactamase superfamily II)